MKNLGFIFLIFLTGCYPSGDIDDFSAYFHNDTTALKANEFAITYFGVSTLLFEDGNTKFMIDGFLTRPPVLKVLFGKLKTDEGLIDKFVQENEIEELDGILVNHTHYDHALDAAYLAKSTSAILYGSSSAMNLGKGAGLANKHLSEFKSGDIFKIGKFTIEIIAGKHSPTKVLNADLGEEITEPLLQPARFSEYKEGGTFDFIITRGEREVYVKGSPNFIEGKLDDRSADIVFLATGSIGTKNARFIAKFYGETIGKLNPSVVIPIHWDNFLKPETINLVFMPRYMDNASKTFTILRDQTSRDNIDLKILTGHARIVIPFAE